uniref:Helicase C-terminal domain-containing protein n=1 Tax=Globodera pallida TaxID=36090 RepID=A0A183BTI8_GLOPA
MNNRIKFLTDGILLRRADERPVAASLLCRHCRRGARAIGEHRFDHGLLRKIVAIRDDLRVIISSATIEAEIFRDFFELNDNPQQKPDKNTATIISVEGRMFPVATFYTKVGVPDYVQTTVETVLRLHDVEPSGDILAFLTGQDEVERACDFLRKAAKMLSKDKDKLLVVPLYGGLPAREQFRAFDSAPYQSRKAIITTNIAETSVTIAGVATEGMNVALHTERYGPQFVEPDGSLAPVGLLSQKVLGAVDFGVRRMILSSQNVNHVLALPEEDKRGMEFVYDASCEEILERMF